MFRGVRKLFGKVDIFVNGFPSNAKSEELMKILPSSSTISIKSHYGFITIDENENVKEVLEKLNHTKIYGSKLNARINLRKKNTENFKVENQYQAKGKIPSVESQDFISEYPEQQVKSDDKDTDDKQKFSFNYDNIKKKFESKPQSKIENPKAFNNYAKKPDRNSMNLNTNKQERSQQQIYLEAISRLKDPFEHKEDYAFREDFALGSRLQERGFK